CLLRPGTSAVSFRLLLRSVEALHERYPPTDIRPLCLSQFGERCLIHEAEMDQLGKPMRQLRVAVVEALIDFLPLPTQVFADRPHLHRSRNRGRSRLEVGNSGGKRLFKRASKTRRAIFFSPVDHSVAD